MRIHHATLRIAAVAGVQPFTDCINHAGMSEAMAYYMRMYSQGIGTIELGSIMDKVVMMDTVIMVNHG